MKKYIRRHISMILCMIMVLLTVVPVFGKTVTKTETICSSPQAYYLPLWHYSGGYWVIGSGSSKIKVTDREISKFGGIEEYLTENYTSVDFSVPIPAAVKTAMAEGAAINVKLQSRGQADWKTIFDKESLIVSNDIDSGGNYEFSLTPIFHLVRGRDYTDFVAGLTSSIPLIHNRYGFNMYSLFGNGKSAVQSDGYYNEGNARYIYSPFIHPSMITDTKGHLAPGYPITVNDSVVSSDGYRVGDGTFSSSGAVGIQFEFPINVVFEKVTVSWVDDPVDPGNGSQGEGGSQGENPGGNSGQGENGDPADPGQGPEQDIHIKAVLNLPAESYEGKAVSAMDVSEFKIDGKDYTARTAIAEGLADHWFDAPGARTGKESPIDIELTYDNAGTYPVTLNVETANGLNDTDSKCIKIKPCPSISVNLGGSQKQNRKQTLDVRVQQHPSYPIKSLNITVTELGSGETISVNRSFSGTQPAPVNTDHIKYRSLYDTDPDKYCVACTLDFLSKFAEDKTFRYTVTASDSRGRSDTKTADFKVVKDVPPIASIDIEPVYYRNKGSNTAVITVSDGSGKSNYKRSWTYVGTNFSDLSYGTQKKVSFERSGVGPFTVGLTVTDMWDEETLEEYITPQDHLSASASASSLVDNLAPSVSFEMNKEKNAEILLLAQDDATKAVIDSVLPSVNTQLTAEGINARIAVDRQTDAGKTEGGEIGKIGNIYNELGVLGSVNLLDSVQTSSSFWTSGHVTADNSSIYSMNSGNVCLSDPRAAYKTLKRTYPYTIKSHDENLNIRWSFNVYENLFSSPTDFCKARFAHDVQSQYLYLISDGKTLILNKKDGSLLQIAETEMGYANYVSGRKIYTIRKDGVYFLDQSGMHAISPLQILADDHAVQFLKGCFCFIAKENGKLVYCVFDPQTEQLKKTVLNTADTSSLIAMDTRGYAVIRESGGNFKVFSSGGNQVGQASMSASYAYIAPSYDASGRINYVCGSYNQRIRFRDELTSYNYLAVSSLFTDYSDTAYVAVDGDEYRNCGKVEYAFECKDGTVSMTLPCHVYSLSYTIYDSQISYNFQPKDKTKTYGILISSGLPATHYAGWFEGGFFVSYFNTSVNDIASVMRQQESESEELARLKSKWLRGGCDVSLCLSYGGNFDPEKFIDLVKSQFNKPEPVVKTYAKGQTINYDVHYSDWENDPSKASYWVYTHVPGTDGLWENSGKVLTSPVTKFEKNGKYTLTHWQTDSAGRGLTTAYDKDSEPCTMIFYITGGGDPEENKPPVVESISIEPQNVYVGDTYTLNAVVSDPDSDTLNVKIEIYKKGETTPLKVYEKNGLKPSGGTYPKVVITDAPKAEAGTYQIAVTVSDGSATGTGSCAFTPKIKASLNGSVFHTDIWDSNRQNFNLKYFGKTYGDKISDYAAYKKSGSPRIRGKNVFWPGEELQLAADLKGEVTSVKAVISGTGYSAVLKASGKAAADGTQTFSGVMYDKTMQKDLAKDNPRQVTIRFTASYSDGSTLTFDVPVIFDQDIGYWMIHRTK